MARKYDYGTHECLDRTFLVMEMLSYVSEHPQAKENAEWLSLAEKAHGVLWDLYQSIGINASEEDSTVMSDSELGEAYRDAMGMD